MCGSELNETAAPYVRGCNEFGDRSLSLERSIVVVGLSYDSQRVRTSAYEKSELTCTSIQPLETSVDGLCCGIRIRRGLGE